MYHKIASTPGILHFWRARANQQVFCDQFCGDFSTRAVRKRQKNEVSYRFPLAPGGTCKTCPQNPFSEPRNCSRRAEIAPNGKPNLFQPVTFSRSEKFFFASAFWNFGEIFLHRLEVPIFPKNKLCSKNRRKSISRTFFLQKTVSAKFIFCERF